MVHDLCPVLWKRRTHTCLQQTATKFWAPAVRIIFRMYRTQKLSQRPLILPENFAIFRRVSGQIFMRSTNGQHEGLHLANSFMWNVINIFLIHFLDEYWLPLNLSVFSATCSLLLLPFNYVNRQLPDKSIKFMSRHFCN